MSSLRLPKAHGQNPYLSALPAMDQGEFQRWAELLEDRTGMTLGSDRKSFLVTSVGMRMHEVGYDSFDAYYECVTSGRDAVREWSELVHRLTVHETRFFRDPAGLQLIGQYAREKLENADSTTSLHVWSAGCATGEEVYSISIELEQGLRSSRHRMTYSVTGTDISQPALNTGRHGVYHRHKVTGMNAGLLRTYFSEVDDNHVRVEPRLRKRVCFLRSNLMDLEKERLADMDIIICQNVLIYFKRAVRERVVAGMVKFLRPRGLLILGTGELVGWRHPKLQKVNAPNTLAFMKRAA